MTNNRLAAGAAGSGVVVDVNHGLRPVARSGVRAPRRTGGMDMRKVKRVTILELVEAVQDIARSDEEAVAVLTHLLRSARLSRPLPAAA